MSLHIDRALTNQFDLERQCLSLYVAAAGCCDRDGYPCFSHAMRLQAREEVRHLTWIAEYARDRHLPLSEGSGRVELPSGGTEPNLFWRILTVEKEALDGVRELRRLGVRDDEPAVVSLAHRILGEQALEERRALWIVRRLATSLTPDREETASKFNQKFLG